MTSAPPAPPSFQEIEAFLSALRDPSPLYVELVKRGIDFCVWEGGWVVAGQEPARLNENCAGPDDPDDGAIASYFDLEEAAWRLGRGEALEALIHLERAIPALDGLHDAVLNLKR